GVVVAAGQLAAVDDVGVVAGVGGLEDGALAQGERVLDGDGALAGVIVKIVVVKEADGVDRTVAHGARHGGSEVSGNGAGGAVGEGVRAIRRGEVGYRVMRRVQDADNGGAVGDAGAGDALADEESDGAGDGDLGAAVDE